MKASRRVPATRDGLAKARRRLERVERGRDLLRRKREALVRRLLGLSGPLREDRRRIRETAAAAYDALRAALASESREVLEATGWTEGPADAGGRRRIEVEARPTGEWGVPVAAVEGRTPVRRDLRGRATPPTGVGLGTVTTAERFEELVELLLEVAGREARIERLGRALARASRQAETLERRVAPSLERGIRRVGRVLDEREREEKLRRRHLARRRAGWRPGVNRDSPGRAAVPSLLR